MFLYLSFSILLSIIFFSIVLESIVHYAVYIFAYIIDNIVDYTNGYFADCIVACDVFIIVVPIVSCIFLFLSTYCCLHHYTYCCLYIITVYHNTHAVAPKKQ